MHKKWQPIGKSTFEIYGELLNLKRESSHEIRFTLRNINTWSNTQLVEARNLLEKLSQNHLFFRGEQQTIWQQSELTSLDSQKREEIYEKIEKLSQHIKLVKDSGHQLATLFKVESPKTLNELESTIRAARHVADVPIDKPRNLPQGVFNDIFENATRTPDVPKIPKIWFKGNNLNLLKQRFSELQNDYDLEEELASYLNKKYQVEFLNQDLSSILVRCNKWGIFRCFQKKYWQDIKLIMSFRKVIKSISDEQLKNDLEKGIELKKLRCKLADDKYPPNLAFKNFFIRNKPDLFSIKQALIWLEELNPNLPSEVVSELIYSESSRQNLLDILKQLNWQNTTRIIEHGFNELREYFAYPEKIMNTSNIYFQHITFDKIDSFLDKATNELDLFRKWLDYQENLDELKLLGLEAFLDKLKISNIPADYWCSLFLKGFYNSWLQYIYDNSAEIRCFNYTIHEGQIRQFGELDKLQYKFAKTQLRRIHVDEWKKWSEELNTATLISYLKRETQKPRKQVREFITEAGNLILALKPCWLMSPLAVSDYIPPEMNYFDAVLFDEASQIYTEDSISSIMRAKQVIVVGDIQQMPPSSFFSSVTSDDDDEETEEEAPYDSLLAECGKFMKERTLKWHYRSQDESLIAFSNRKFYESQFITFPNPIKDKNRGVFFHPVPNGIYQPNAKEPNTIEAEEIAQLVLEHVEKSNHLSLGIIAFSKKQADTIQLKVKELGRDNPDLAEFCRDDSNKFFVKNLENMQGDESDVIILGFGYGKDNEGNFKQNFGPLTWAGGEKRLNVAITRAKCKLILVASITPDLLSASNSQGARCFKEYFEYIQQTGEELRKEENQNTKADYHFNPLIVNDIYHALQEQGYQVETSVGRSGYPIDLAVIRQQESKEFLLGIECDGLIYKKYPTARDRDRLRRIVLEEKLGWQIHRIWSKEWYENRDSQIKLLVERIQRLEDKK
ncbi:MAG: hypothetical protein KME64_18825 [Scytonematopsis contorta HA4267-MV1]|nr:hypothetical protein [Scytonematopsis contorta HA4267-MV1]